MPKLQFKALRDSKLVSAQAPLKKTLNYKYSKVLLPSSKGSDIVGVMRQLMTAMIKAAWSLKLRFWVRPGGLQLDNGGNRNLYMIQSTWNSKKVYNLEKIIAKIAVTM